IAQHWELACDALEASRWHWRAGRWMSATDRAGAIRHWEKTRELLGTVPDTDEAMKLGLSARVRILGLSWYRGITDAHASELFEEGKSLAGRRKDLRSLAKLEWGYAATRLIRGRLGDYLGHLHEVGRLAEQTYDHEFHYALGTLVVEAHTFTGDLKEAQRIAT